MRTETKLIKPLLQTVAVSLSLFIGWSRISDNKHFLSDVVAGFTLGAIFAWFIVSYVSFIITLHRYMTGPYHLGPVVRKPINANPRLQSIQVTREQYF